MATHYYQHKMDSHLSINVHPEYAIICALDVDFVNSFSGIPGNNNSKT